MSQLRDVALIVLGLIVVTGTLAFGVFRLYTRQ